MKTRWSLAAVRSFELFFKPWMHRQLAHICMTGRPDDVREDRTVILAANHTSWWDAFLLREIHRKYAGSQPLITLMREDQLRRFPFFRWMGVTGIGGSAGTTRETVRLLRRFRSRGPLWISMFPQGTIRASWQRPMEFRRGLEFFAREVRPALVVPVGIHLEMLKYPAPTAFLSIGRAVPSTEEKGCDRRVVEKRVAAQLDVIYQHVERWGEEAAEMWPPESSIPAQRQGRHSSSALPSP